MSTEYCPVGRIDWQELMEMVPPPPLRWDSEQAVTRRLYDAETNRYIWVADTKRGAVFELFGSNQDEDGDVSIKRISQWLDTELVEQ